MHLKIASLVPVWCQILIDPKRASTAWPLGGYTIGNCSSPELVLSKGNVKMETKHPLRVMRERHDLSLHALAEVTGLSKRTILRAEQGYAISPNSRYLLCAYFTKLEKRQITSQRLGLITTVQEQSLPEEKQSVLAVEATEAMEMDKNRRDFII